MVLAAFEVHQMHVLLAKEVYLTRPAKLLLSELAPVVEVDCSVDILLLLEDLHDPVDP